MRVAVTGSSGLIGTPLVARLQAEGHDVVRVVRRPVSAGESALRWDPAAGTIDAAALAGVDAVVNLAGPGIGDKRWTEERKRELVESRTHGTALLASTLAALDPRPSVLVSGSAIGYYGERGDEVLTESSGPGDDLLARLCVDWEAATAPAADAGIRVATIRTGIVLTTAGGALPKLLPLFKLGLGGKMGSGRQWWSWITLRDEIDAIVWLLTHDLAGPVNLTAPAPTTNAELTKAARRAAAPAHVPDRPEVRPRPGRRPRAGRRPALHQPAGAAGRPHRGRLPLLGSRPPRRPGHDPLGLEETGHLRTRFPMDSMPRFRRGATSGACAGRRRPGRSPRSCSCCSGARSPCWPARRRSPGAWGRRRPWPGWP